jgi:hypothetical protein
VNASRALEENYQFVKNVNINVDNRTIRANHITQVLLIHRAIINVSNHKPRK